MDEISQAISGTTVIEEFDENSEQIIGELLSDINTNNETIIQEQNSLYAEEEKARIEADIKAKEELRATLLREKSEAERLERERIAAEEAEALRLEEEEHEKKKQANPLYKMMNAMKRKPSKEVEEETALEDSEENQCEDVPKAKKDTNKKKKISEKEQRKEGKPVEKKKSNSKSIDFEYLATHDEKTGLFNNTAFKMALEEADITRIVIVYCDINGLKATNDMFGHEYGDKLLIESSGILNNIFPNCVYRIGGDEFVLLLYGIQKYALIGKLNEATEKLDKLTSEDKDGLIYSFSAGFAFGDGKKTIKEIINEADKMMYSQKEEYYKNHPELKSADSLKKKTKAISEKEEEKDDVSKYSLEEYNALLPKRVRELKETITDCHEQVSEESVDRILAEIQSRYQEVQAILIASKTFNHLFIIRDIRHFMEMVMRMDGLIDYSYLYVVYENGTQYYGSDEYYDEVTDLFRDIAGTIKYNMKLTQKDILKIKGINVFQKIYIG